MSHFHLVRKNQLKLALALFLELSCFLCFLDKDGGGMLVNIVKITKSTKKLKEYEKWWSEVYELYKEDIDAMIKT